MQWLGGIGIIVMATTVLPLLKVGGMQLFQLDTSGTEKILPKTVEISVLIISIYTAKELMIVSNLNVWESIDQLDGPQIEFASRITRLVSASSYHY